MSTPPTKPPLTLVQRVHDQEREDEIKPLEWGLIRRLLGCTRPFARKRNALIVLTVLRATQLPALAWLASLIIAGPIARHEAPVLTGWVAGYAALALFTDGLCHFSQRLALE